MQRSAWRPTSSASTASARVEQHEVELRGPSPSRTPVHSDVYGFIRSAVEERGRSWSITSRSRHSGSTFSIPITRDQDPRQRRAHAPVALGLHHADRPRLRHAEVRAADRHGHGEELLAQVPAGGLGDRRRLEPELCPAAIVRSNSAAISARFLWMAGTRMCDGSSSPSCTISSARSVSIARMPRPPAPREPDLVRGQRLDLDHLVAAVVARDPRHDRVRLRPVARPVHDPAGPRHRRLEALELLGQRGQRAVLDRRARRPQRLPVVDLGHRPGPLDPDRVTALPRLRRSWVSEQRHAGGGGEAGVDVIPAPPAPRRCASPARRPAAASAPRRCASGRTCPPPCRPRRGCRARGAACRTASPSTCRRS